MFSRRYRLLLALTLIVPILPESTNAADQFVYVSVAGDHKISLFRLSEDGALRHSADFPIGGDPGGLTMDPTRRFLFASIRSMGYLASFEVDPVTGSLRQQSWIKADADPAFVETDHTGKFLLTAYYVAGKAAVHPSSPTGEVLTTGSQWVDTLRRAHAIRTCPDNLFAYVPHTKPNRIFQFRFDAKAGKLIALDPATVETPHRSGPRQLFFHPTQPYVIFDNEQGSSVTSFRRDLKTGQLTAIDTKPTIPKSHTTGNSCARLEGTKDGRFVYAANRGHDSIAGFAIDEKTGKLTPLGEFATEKTPRGFDLCENDEFLVAAGQDSNRLAVYEVGKGGMLRRIGGASTGPVPWWVMITSVNDAR